jgi:hypothetical protein
MWWTADRSRLVPTGDPDAAVLAYTAGDEVADSEAARVGLVPAKATAKPLDKARTPSANKGAS